MGIDTNKTILPPEFLRYMEPKERKKFGVAGMLPAEAQAKIDSESERELQNQIENWFRLNGIPAFRNRMDKKSTAKVGQPDFLVCFKGAFWAFEIKAGKNQATQEQLACLVGIANAGGSGFVVRSLQEVKKHLLGLPF